MVTLRENEAAPRKPGRPSDVMNAQEAATLLRVPVKTMYEMASSGRIPSRKVGKHYRFSRKAVQTWLQGRT